MAEDRGERLTTLLAIVEEPERGPRRLPVVLGSLDADDPVVRSGAVWALSAVAIHAPDTVPYLAERLLNRRHAADSSPAVEAALTYLTARYPDRVEAALDGAASASDGIEAAAVLDNEEVGLPSWGGSPEKADTTGDLARNDAATDSSPGIDDEEWVTPGAREEWAATDRLESVVDRSAFDDLTVLARRRSGRYAEEYRALGALDGDELPVSLALFHCPDGDRAAFRDSLADRLDRWDAVGDHESLLTVYDWGTAPRPWAATEYAGLTLYDRGRLDPGLALWNARRIATALAAAHERGAVHGGLDPGNVAYRGAAIDESDREAPLLANVGLLEPFRHHFDPTERLDPRYAAPEYFDRAYGRVDHATDVYHAGAVVYRLFTGRPPYDGSYDEVRRAVLNEAPPRPGLKVGVPPGLDDVVTKAMAARKLGRYESAGQLARELDEISRAWSDD